MPRKFRVHEKKSQKYARALRTQMTDAEVILWSRIRGEALPGLRFRRQHPIGPYIADFACLSARLVVEVDGGTHASVEEVAHDRIRDSYLRRRGWRVLRVTNTEVYKNLSTVLDYIFYHRRGHRPPPSPSATPPP